MKHRMTVVFASALLASGAAAAADLRVTMNVVTDSGIGGSAGTVTVSETKHGVVFTPALTGVAPGLHGFHVHEKGSCAPSEKDGKQVAANSAGGHYDPDQTKKHGTPWGDGHRGDLPALFVDADGKAANPVLAPRLKMAELKGKALMVHAGGDNHADHPAPLGGGGARVVCGVMK